MDMTAFVLKLIEAYKTEHNRLLRAKAKQQRILSDSEWTLQMNKRKLNFHFICRDADLRHSRNFFKNNDIEQKFSVRFFVSQGVKNASVRKASHRLAIIIAQNGNDSAFVAEKREELEKLKNTPVEAVLGKKWRELIDACIEENKAYKTRWQARCAIYAFNKMDMGIKIKFGNCSRGGGSMSYISRVIVGSDEVKLSKFLDNAIFETVILNG